MRSGLVAQAVPGFAGVGPAARPGVLGRRMKRPVQHPGDALPNRMTTRRGRVGGDHRAHAGRRHHHNAPVAGVYGVGCRVRRGQALSQSVSATVSPQVEQDQQGQQGGRSRIARKIRRTRRRRPPVSGEVSGIPRWQRLLHLRGAVQRDARNELQLRNPAGPRLHGDRGTRW